MKNTQNSTITEATFLSKDGLVVKVKDVISKDECWFLEREGKHVLTHKAIQKIAAIAGISKTYEVSESTIQPDYKNGMEHIVRVTIKCLAKPKDPNQTYGCIHSDENTLTVTGEANRENTSQRGRGYLRKMAEKRAYDIAVLEHLGLYSTIFSEDESESFKKEPVVSEQSISILNTDIEHVRNEINEMLKTKTSEELSAAWKLVEEKQKTQVITPTQKNFLVNVYEKQSKLIAQLTKK